MSTINSFERYLQKERQTMDNMHDYMQSKEQHICLKFLTTDCLSQNTTLTSGGRTINSKFHDELKNSTSKLLCIKLRIEG